ncbi:MAG: hypothetical protein AAFN74_00845 [Myxococcota bacterium]
MVKVAESPVSRPPQAPTDGSDPTDASTAGTSPLGHLETTETTFARTDQPWTHRLGQTEAVRKVSNRTVNEVVPRDPTLRPVIDAMLARLDASQTSIDGETPRSLFEKRILNNPKITDDQIRQMGQVSLDDIRDNRRAQRRTFRKFPDVLDTINHRFTRDLVAGITGLDPQAISEAKPSLGLTGSAQSPFAPLWRATVPEVQIFTALHDTTSVLQSAGVDGFNKALWGQDSTVLSAVLNYPLGAALRDFFGFGRRRD